MKTIHVVAAIIFRTNQAGKAQVLATQRGYGDFKGGWEFPGGKIEAGESPQEALKREIKEELDAQITVKNHLHTIEYDYPAFHLTMECYHCTLRTELTLKEHSAARWLDKSSLYSVDWLPADTDVLGKLEDLLQEQKLDKASDNDHLVHIGTPSGKNYIEMYL